MSSLIHRPLFIKFSLLTTKQIISPATSTREKRGLLTLDFDPVTHHTLKPYLHGDILPGKFLKMEQAIEKSSCKSEIFLCHIVKPLTQLPCPGIERAIFSGKWNSPREFIWYVDGFCIHFCRSPGRKRGKSSCILRYQESHSSTFLFTWSWYRLAEVLVYFASPRKPFIKFLLNKKYTMSPCKTGLTQCSQPQNVQLGMNS